MAYVEGSGTDVTTPGVALPKVMSSKPEVVPIAPNVTDFAMPSNVRPAAVQLQNNPVGSRAQPLALYWPGGKSM